jgi:hypothetical protein
MTNGAAATVKLPVVPELVPSVTRIEVLPDVPMAITADHPVNVTPDRVSAGPPFTEYVSDGTVV